MTTPKFRVWDGEQMHEPPHGFLVSSNGTLQQLNDSNRVKAATDPRAGVYEPQFYTGLTDAEGTEVYEGDIVCNDSGTVQEIIFASGGFTFNAVNGVDIGWVEANYTVIGNRYENPDLLEQEPA